MNATALRSYAARLHALGLRQQPLAKGQVVTDGNQSLARFKDEADAEFFVAVVGHLALSAESARTPAADPPAFMLRTPQPATPTEEGAEA